MNLIGLGTSSVFPAKLEESFAIAKEAGYDGLEIMITNDKQTRDSNYIKSLVEKYSLPVISFHAPVLLLTHFVWGTDPEVKLQKSAELAAEMDSDTVVVHPPFSWQGKYSVDFLKIVEKISNDTGVHIGVENMFPWRMRGKEVKAYKPSWEEIISVTPKITLDFSHAALAGLDSLAVAENLGDKLHHIHLCDGIGKSNPEEKDKIFDEHLPPGLGNQPVAKTLTMLAGKSWNGHVVAEINTRKYRGRDAKIAVLKETTDFARNALTAGGAH
jgi:sugar phosphate isomerase/epimerase